MGLRERMANRKPMVTAEKLDTIANSKDCKQYRVFLRICGRLQECVDLKDIQCGTYQEVFEQIEKNNIDISDIVPRNKYRKFKNDMIASPVQMCPTLGKKPDKIYDFNKEEDRIEYAKLHGNVMF